MEKIEEGSNARSGASQSRQEPLVIGIGMEFEMILRVPQFKTLSTKFLHDPAEWRERICRHVGKTSDELKTRNQEYRRLCTKTAGGSKQTWTDKEYQEFNDLNEEIPAVNKKIKDVSEERGQQVAVWLHEEWQNYCDIMSKDVEELYEEWPNKPDPTSEDEQERCPRGIKGYFDDFVKVGMKNAYDDSPDYSKWSITFDPAVVLPLDCLDCFAFEFVGPVMGIEGTEESQNMAVMKLFMFFDFLTSHCECAPMDSVISTSTHVHVSPGRLGEEGYETAWSVEAAHKISASAYFWEPCVRYLIPAWRRFRDYATDWRTTELDFRQPEERYRNYKTFPDGFYPMIDYEGQALPQPFLKCTRKDIKANLEQILSLDSYGRLATGIHGHVKNVSWNLLNLMGNTTKQTIEFRRAPASRSWIDAVCWLDLIYSFTRAAMALPDGGIVESLMSVKEPGPLKFYEWLKPHRLENSTFKRYLTVKMKKMPHQELGFYYLTDEEEKRLERMRSTVGNKTYEPSEQRATPGMTLVPTNETVAKLIDDEIRKDMYQEDLLSSRRQYHGLLTNVLEKIRIPDWDVDAALERYTRGNDPTGDSSAGNNASTGNPARDVSDKRHFFGK